MKMSKTNIIEVKLQCNHNEIGVLLALPYQISHVSFGVKYTEYTEFVEYNEYISDTIYIIEEYGVAKIISHGKYYDITGAQNINICKYYEQDMDELNNLLETAVRKYEENFFDSKEYVDYLQGN